MAVINAAFGTMTIDDVEVLEITNIEANVYAAADEYHTNNTSGGTKSTMGVKRHDGSFQIADHPSVDEGDAVTIQADTGQDVWVLPVRITQIAAPIPIGDGGTMIYTVSFAPNGVAVKALASDSV